MDWKKQFDEKFSKLEWVIDYSKIPHDGKTVVVGEMPKAEEIKAFISDLLEKEREKARREVIAELGDMVRALNFNNPDIR